MSVSSIDQQPRSAPFWIVGVLCAFELMALSAAYKHGFEFVCRDVLPTAFCAFFGNIVPRSLGVLAALGVFAVARPAARALILTSSPSVRTGIAVNIAGFALALVPWILSGQAPVPPLALAALWATASVALVGGLALCLAGIGAWGTLARRHGLTLVVLVALGAALPEFAAGLFGLWHVDVVTNVTFAAVLAVLAAFGYAVTSNVEWKQIAHDDFAILVGPQCSGVEGFALITLFVAVFIALFRRDLRFPHVLALFPLGLALSWSFNVLRISVLMMIGIDVSPDLAVGGFHSHAGWLAFTMLSTGLIAVAYHVPVFRAKGDAAPAPVAARAVPPLREDPVAAFILPFAVFMLSALFASTFSEQPAILYPLRALAVAAAIAVFWRLIAALPWRLDPLALSCGVACGVIWVWTAGPPEAADTAFAARLEALPAVALAVWVASRVIGTAILVPVVEELFFRGYLQDRISGALSSRTGVLVAAFVAIGVSSAAFGALHDRWLAAFVAGVLFGLVYLRRRNVTDAILCHAAANIVIAAAALRAGDWSLI